MNRCLPMLFMIFWTMIFSEDVFAQFNESDIVITEISYNPPESGVDSLEYIELYNVGSSSINIGGYTFTQGITYTFPSYVLAPGAYVLVAVDSMAMLNNFGVTAFQWTSGGLSNSGEDIVLYTAGGILVDSVDYDDNGAWPTSPDGGGPSLVLCDPLSDNNLAASWAAATTDAGFTINGQTVFANPGAASNCPPPCPDINAGITADTTFISCFGLSDGAIDLTLNNGTTPFTFLWSNGDTTEDVSGLSSGFYEVSITDANGCQGSFGAFLQQPDELTVSVTVSTAVSCNGLSDGEVTAATTGGTTPYHYVWSNSDTTVSVSGVGAGNFSVTVTDANGCTATDNGTVTEPTALAATVAVDSNAACNGSSDGGLTASATGGSGSYNYLWSNGGATATITGVGAGTYTVSVTDGNGCSTTANGTVTEPSVLAATVAVDSNATCNGASTGGLTASAFGGRPLYTYLWSNGGVTASITGVGAGTYTVSVTDGNGCLTTANGTVTEPTALIASVVVDSNATCNGIDNGGLTASATGGSGPYAYLWSNGGITVSITGVGAGTYTVTVTDANGCTSTDNGTVTELSPISATVVVDSNATCNGASTGGLTVSATGGNGSYTYLWSNGATTASITGVVADSYTVTVTDGNTCIATASGTVTEPAAITLSAAITSAGCNGATNGEIDLTITNGSGPFDIDWGGGINTEDRTNLAAGTYSVVVTDQNGCSAVGSYNVSGTTAINITATTTNVSCNGGSDGAIDITVTGGVAPYIYNWSGVLTSIEDLAGIEAGSYSVTVVDDSSCSTIASYTVTEPSAIVVAGTMTDNACPDSLTGAIDLVVSGGTGTYNYTWSNNDTTAALSGIAAGSFLVTVTDQNLCEVLDTFDVANASATCVTGINHVDLSANDLMVYPNPSTDVLNVALTGSGTIAKIELHSLSGSQVLVVEPSATSSMLDVSELAGGMYILTVHTADGSIGRTKILVSDK